MSVSSAKKNLTVKFAYGIINPLSIVDDSTVKFAAVAQLVERRLGKAEVTSSNLVSSLFLCKKVESLLILRENRRAFFFF